MKILISKLKREDYPAIDLCMQELHNFVHKKYRRKGIAKKIFEQLEKQAKEQGAERVDLMVWHSMKLPWNYINH